MKSITSRDNSQYKELKLIATNSQARRKAGQTLLDGVHLCEAYFQHRGAPELCIVSEFAADDHEVQALLVQCEKQGVRCICLPEPLYKGIRQVENGVGIMFLISTPTLELSQDIDATSVVLDNLQDPGNLGSILRSAAAAGVKNVFCSPGTVLAWSPKVMRAGMGAHFLLNIYENVELAPLLQVAKIPVLATSSHTSKTIYQADLNRAVIWLFGHEGQGVSKDLMAMATHTLTIPQQASIESLNVAASAAICFFEQVRQQLK